MDDAAVTQAHADARLTVNSQPVIDEAVAFWNNSENDRFEFCVLASKIVGEYEEGATKSLADRIERSVSTVQNFARVGILWNALEPQDAEEYRDKVKYSFWPPIASLYQNEVVSITGVKHWFDEKIKHKMTVEKFRSLLPTVEGGSVWKKSAKAGLRQIKVFLDEELINSPAFDVDPKQYRKVRRVLVVASKRIQDAIKD